MAERLSGFHLDEQGDWVLSSTAGTGSTCGIARRGRCGREGGVRGGAAAHLRKVLRCVRCDEDVVMRTSEEG